MKQFKRLLSGLLCLALAAALLCPAQTATAASGVMSTTATIAGSTARVVYVTMTEGRALVPLVANNSVGTDASASSIIASASTGTVVAAMNGGFFNSYYNSGAALSVNTGNYPQCYSTIVSEGVPVLNGGKIYAIGMDYDNNIYIDYVELTPNVTLRGSVTINCWGVNKVYTDASSVYALTDKLDYTVQIPSDFKVVTIQGGKVTSVSGGGSVRVADGATVLVYGPTIWNNYAQWGSNPQVGDSAVLGYSATPSNTANTQAWNNMRTVIAGGGVLVLNGVNRVDDNTNTAADQNPDTAAQRTFIAKLSDGRILMGSVSGTFRRIADSLIAMGATDALYMDGGASAMVYANGSFSVSAGRKLATVVAFVDETTSPVKPVKATDSTSTSTSSGSSAASAQTNSNTPSSWAESYLEEARSLGLLPDELDGKYQNSITRKEFCNLLARLVRLTTGKSIEYYCSTEGYTVDPAPFSDTTAYYAPYMAALGLVTGYEDGTFRPNNFITRQDAAIILQRLAVLLGVDSSGGGKTFTDEASISGYAKAGVAFVSALSIMNGRDDGSFAPRDNITREQAVITACNAYHAFVG